ncbi:unnamed protein product [Citrullus colocynthis]|uniref:Response regulatory domain-containing protein n=1 Tax=Citrullus colocynthis TaxID=252529 RepID=A0ABP0ZHI7_9ROSI
MATVPDRSRRNPIDRLVGISDDSKQSCSSTQLHVLAVDDSLVDRKVIERLLKISSCKVTAVESGRSALQYLGLDGENNSVQFSSGLKVNLIITDYSMPEMTGYELLKKIKESSAFREIPVVIMSSENILARIDSCLKEGAEEFIVKPVKLSDVKRLKDFIMEGENEGKKIGLKRKLHLDHDHDHHPSSPVSPASSAAVFDPCHGFLQRSAPSFRRSSKKPRFLDGN